MKPKLLFSHGSQHSRRVRILVHELGIDVEEENVPFGPDGFGGDQRDAFLALNPNGKVPVLRHGDVVLWESNAIMGYLGALHGDNALLPADPAEQAQVTMWQVWQSAHLTPAADGLFYENFAKPTFLKQETDAAQVERQTEAFHRWLGVMEHYLDNADYLALDRFTAADISCAAALMYAEAARMPVDEHPKVATWLDRIRARDSWKATEPPPYPG